MMSEQSTHPAARENGHKTGMHDDAPPTAMARWDPVEIFESLQDEMDRFWRRLGPQLPMTPRFRFRGTARAGWAPRIDVFERGNELVIKADLPGMKKENVQVEVTDGVLVIRGETGAENESKGEQYYRVERSYGSFYRRIPLPFDADADHTTATMDDGVLEIHIARPANATQEPHKISIA